MRIRVRHTGSGSWTGGRDLLPPGGECRNPAAGRSPAAGASGHRTIGSRIPFRPLLLACLFGAVLAALPGSVSAFPQDDPAVTAPAAGQSDPSPAASSPGINLFSLLVRGGWFMLPLLGLSLLGAGICIERMIVLQRDRLMPERLVERLARLGQQPGGLDPRDAYIVCQTTPSVASDVLKSVLVKVGRPHMELEHACSEAAQRSAIRLQQPVSWLTLCAAVAPLIGLLGTVWGITQAFYDTTQLEVGQNRADALSRGIYVALVTTIAGLTIAIPATLASHFFESRIVGVLNRIEEMVRGLLPQLERYEGQVRFSPGPADAAGGDASQAPTDRPGAAFEAWEERGLQSGESLPAGSNGHLPDPLPRPTRPRPVSRPPGH